MDKTNPLQVKSFKFALNTIETYKLLVEEKEFVMSKQLLRSGTSIGANIEEALQAQSKKDFIHKLSIALKEAQETGYWIKLLRESAILDKEKATDLYAQAKELMKMLTAIIKTSKSNILKQPIDH
ncbi:MAG: four helix bundle protein [Candidatus Peribacteraceae bacterium]|jgi:four helix bundle protein|nr:four helix bundle protein [Candidatus Peribacteraceae bacterium]MDP7645568.1 four helix bundle protein [Candidatus Peribacteraceae bacterium]|tara:strand:+ start:1173 stop:1547 length:375 start_codon:yes stop_codon:yes gene_type:complete